MTPHRRYPMPMPFGWFQIAWPDELPAGETLPLYYFGRHLVAWRGEDGGAHLMDAFCPHLGSHLGHGGTVEGGCVVCPLHSWKFDAAGNNVDIPYSDRVNRRARIRTYPVVERNGLVMAWYHPDDEPPHWEVPHLEEFDDHPGFSAVYRKHYKLNAHWQEIAETTADAAHVQAHLLRYEKQIGGESGSVPKPGVESYGWESHLAKMRFAQPFPTPQGVVDGRVDTDSHGPGMAHTTFTGLIDTVLLGCAIPVHEERMELRYNFVVARQDDDASTRALADAFVEEIHAQTVEDVPIWENKAYVPRPSLADADGPILPFRKWASQFYAEGVADGTEGWEPAPPTDELADALPA